MQYYIDKELVVGLDERFMQKRRITPRVNERIPLDILDTESSEWYWKVRLYLFNGTSLEALVAYIAVLPENHVKVATELLFDGKFNIQQKGN